MKQIFKNLSAKQKIFDRTTGGFIVFALAALIFSNTMVAAQSQSGEDGRTAAPEAVFTNSTPITIVDNNVANPYPSNITVSGFTGTIPTTAGSVKVTLNNFTHSFPDDVAIALVGPTGAAFLLQSGATDGVNGNSASNVTYTISDTGATALPDNSALVNGTTYRPATYYTDDSFPAPGPGTNFQSPAPVGTATFSSVFGGTNPNGVWKLFVTDFVPGDSGVISGGWTLDIAGTTGPSVTQKAPLDFNNDGKTDFALGGLARQLSPTNPLQLTFYIQPNTYPNQPGTPSNSYQQPFGLVNATGSSEESDLAVPEDFDGDGRADIAVWRPRNGQCSGLPASPDRACFYVLMSATNTFRDFQFGRAGDNPRVSGDYDGDGKADFAVYRRAEVAASTTPCGGTGRGVFFYNPSSAPTQFFRYGCWGATGDVPIKGDFNADKRLDYAVQRSVSATSAVYLINYSSSNTERVDDSIFYGYPSDIIAPGDYDADGRTDIAVLRPIGTTATSNYSISILSTATRANLRFNFLFGFVGDIIAPGDYNGDGSMDIGFYRQNTGTFFTTLSGLPATSDYAVRFGTSSDLPLASYNVFSRSNPAPAAPKDNQ